jgi:hypothetical protein
VSGLLDIIGAACRPADGSDRPYAVEDVSFAVGEREIVCVVGESGSGKSLTARAVMGLLPEPKVRASAGRIDFEGRDLLAVTPAERRRLRGERLSMIFQEPMTALNPLMTVGRQIEEVLIVHKPALKAAERRARVLALLEEVHLPEPPRIGGLLSAPALGRAASAGDDRHGADPRPQAAGRRRADHGARRDHAGADPQADRASYRRATAPASCSSPMISAWWPRSRTGSW